MHRKRRRPFGRPARAYARIRMAVAVLLITGGILLFLWARGGAISLDQRKTAQMEAFLAPVVMADPPAFGSPSQLSEEMACQISLLAVLSEDGGENCLTDDAERRIIPFEWVEQKGHAILGDGVSILPHSFSMGEVPYSYEEDDNAFHVPITVQTGYYTPQVQGVKEGGGKWTVYVEYLPADGWAKEGSEWVAPSPVKFVEFTLTGSEEAPIIQSMVENSGTSQ